MSYEHRGLVIGVKQKLLYVLPIFSYNPAKHLDVYHPSVLKLNDIRTVSVNRILYQQHGAIPLSSDTYKKIEELVLQKYFPSFMYEYTQMKQKLSVSETTLKEKEEALKSFSSENEELKRQIEQLNKKLANTDNQ